MNAFRFPDGFSLGVASAATQVDGDCQNSNWYDWYQKGHIKDGSNPDIATRHRDYLEADTALMASMGIRHYRFGLEWARIEPEEGVFSEEEFAKVRTEIALLRKNGIDVLMTLHHFSNPLWFERRGGFLADDYLSVFLRFVEKTVQALGDLVCEYITINESNVYAVSAYFGGDFPPGKNNIGNTLQIIKRLGVCHRRAYQLIHAVRERMGYQDTKVSFAHHMRTFEPMNRKNPWHRICCSLSKAFFQENVSRSYLIGTTGKRGIYADFLAINYYARTASRGFADSTFPGVPVNDLGWEIYPAGIVKCCADLHKILPDLPIYITENGTADNMDAFRRHYLYDHLKALSKSGLPVTRYYHWCFVDNFEWLEGFTARFGLVALNTETLSRTIKKSGEFYKAMIAEGGVTEEMAQEALAEDYNIG